MYNQVRQGRNSEEEQSSRLLKDSFSLQITHERRKKLELSSFTIDISEYRKDIEKVYITKNIL